MFQRKNQISWKKKIQKSLISPKKLIFIENQKRLEKSKRFDYRKKRILPKIKLLQKTHHFNFPKVIREIRFPANKPRFRFWNQNKFYFSNTLQFSKNLSLAYQFKRFVFPKFLKKRFWDTVNSNPLEKQTQHRQNKLHLGKKENFKNSTKLSKLYRKRGFLEKSKK